MNILTFDIEEWFHIKFDFDFLDENKISKYENRIDNNMQFIFDILDQHKLKATFFCLGWVARKYPHILKEIANKGHELGSHSNQHKLVYHQNRKNFSEDLRISIQSIEDTVGKKVELYRAPSFSINESNTWAFEERAKQGIKIDCSIFPAKRKIGGYKDFSSRGPSKILTKNNIEIKEFPINTYKLFNKSIIFSGGGYFRILPYFILKKMMNKSDYVMTYFHPRDFDPNQPILDDISFIRYFKSYIGLSKSKNKIDRSFNDFKFMNVGEASSKVDWAKVPLHKL